MLNEARENTEKIIDELFERHNKTGRRTHYSRKKARNRYLRIAKQKKPKVKQRKAAVKQQIEYVEGNLQTIESILGEVKFPGISDNKLQRLSTIQELADQQKIMQKAGTNKCENRIVSLRQPHIRPIVRGKMGKRYEFGQKPAFSVVNGYTFIEKQDFDILLNGIKRHRNFEDFFRPARKKAQ